MTLPTWVPASERKPAPAPLLLVQAFVNTRNLDLGTDLLADADAASRWLADAGLRELQSTATAGDLRVARDVREGIRALLADNAGAPSRGDGGGDGNGDDNDDGNGDGDLSALRAIMHDSRLELALGADGRIELSSERVAGLRPALLSLLLVIRDAQHDGTWSRLKICGNQDCRWAFFDRSHSRQGAWCDMASCGNLIKNRNLRARQASQAKPARH
jgi:predicted RNA-binding Zn ribbon-like protein